MKNPFRREYVLRNQKKVSTDFLSNMKKVETSFLPNMEYEKQYKMRYQELCAYLQKKYGMPNESYFLKENCKSKNNKITRTKDGLFIHHIKENIFPDLSKPDMAILCPWDFQLAENLVYCNYIEHLMLHIKIVKEFYKQGLMSGCRLGVGGISYIVDAISDAYARQEPYSQEWRECVKNAIKNDEETFKIIKKEAEKTLIFAQIVEINIKIETCKNLLRRETDVNMRKRFEEKLKKLTETKASLSGR